MAMFIDTDASCVITVSESHKGPQVAIQVGKRLICHALSEVTL